MNYRKIWEAAYGTIPKDEQGRSYEIHHIDGNRSNNSLENLACLSIKEHYEVHFEQGDYQAAALIAEKLNLTESERLNILDNIRKIMLSDKNPMKNLEIVKRFSENRKGMVLSKKHRENIGLSLKGKPKPVRSVEHLNKLKEANRKRSKTLLHVESGFTYKTRREAAEALNCTPGNIGYHLKAGNFKYLDKKLDI